MDILEIGNCYRPKDYYVHMYTVQVYVYMTQVGAEACHEKGKEPLCTSVHSRIQPIAIVTEELVTLYTCRGHCVHLVNDLPDSGGG